MMIKTIMIKKTNTKTFNRKATIFGWIKSLFFLLEDIDCYDDIKSILWLSLLYSYSLMSKRFYYS